MSDFLFTGVEKTKKEDKKSTVVPVSFCRGWKKKEKRTAGFLWKPAKNSSCFLPQSARTRGGRGRWWRGGGGRGGSVALTGALLWEPYWCHIPVFLLPASSADGPLGWSELPRHPLCGGRRLRQRRLPRGGGDCGGGFGRHGGGLRGQHAGGDPADPPGPAAVVAPVLLPEGLAQLLGLGLLFVRVPGWVGRRPLGPCRAAGGFASGGRDSGVATGIWVRQVRVPVTVPGHWVTAQHWHVDGTWSWALRVRLPGSGQQGQSRSVTLKSLNTETVCVRFPLHFQFYIIIILSLLTLLLIILSLYWHY